MYMSLLLQLIITNSNFLEQLKANIVLCIPYISVNFIDSVLGQCSAENVLHSRVQLFRPSQLCSYVWQEPRFMGAAGGVGWEGLQIPVGEKLTIRWGKFVNKTRIFNE